MSADSYSVVNTNIESPRPAPVPLAGRSTDAVLTDDGSRYVVLGTTTEGTRKETITVIDTKGRDLVGTAESEGSVGVRVEVSHDNQRAYVAGYFIDGVLIVDATIPKVIGEITLER